MYDHSYNPSTLTAVLRKGDFRWIPAALRDAFRDTTISAAVQSALSTFNAKNPIAKFHLKKKSAYKIRHLEDDLVVRKLACNLKKIAKQDPTGRSSLVINLAHFLEEGVPYRVYRLDIRSFYESFLLPDIKERTQSFRQLSPLSKRHLAALLNHFAAMGGTGLPRGMAISAVLSDLMMADFDSEIFSDEAVYFYGRYVDDIVIVTNLTEDEHDFLDRIRQKLPQGLQLNTKKTSVNSLPKRPIRQKDPATEPLHKFDVDYLGYRFSIFEPLVSDKETKPEYRRLRVEIAPVKMRKIKLRIARTLLDFHRTKDGKLLTDRIKYLTSNFNIVDRDTGKRILAGIFFGYPLLSKNAKSLTSLDQFLRNAVLSKKGRIFTKSAASLTPSLKRTLLAQRFSAGHTQRRFIHFPATRISEIQECWEHE